MSADAVLFAFPLGDRRMHRANELDDPLFLSRAALLLKALLIILVSDHPGDRFKFGSFWWELAENSFGNSLRICWELKENLLGTRRQLTSHTAKFSKIF